MSNFRSQNYQRSFLHRREKKKQMKFLFLSSKCLQRCTCCFAPRDPSRTDVHIQIPSLAYPQTSAAERKARQRQERGEGRCLVSILHALVVCTAVSPCFSFSLPCCLGRWDVGKTWCNDGDMKRRPKESFFFSCFPPQKIYFFYISFPALILGLKIAVPCRRSGRTGTICNVTKCSCDAPA